MRLLGVPKALETLGEDAAICGEVFGAANIIAGEAANIIAGEAANIIAGEGSGGVSR